MAKGEIGEIEVRLFNAYEHLVKALFAKDNEKAKEALGEVWFYETDETRKLETILEFFGLDILNPSNLYEKVINISTKKDWIIIWNMIERYHCSKDYEKFHTP